MEGALLDSSSSNMEGDYNNKLDSSRTRSAPSFGGPSSYGMSTSTPSRYVQHRDIVIVGGGLAGLSIALYLTQLDPRRHVTILDREDQQSTRAPKGGPAAAFTTVSSWAAAGMLAPHAERLPQGPLLTLCEESRQMYPDFVNLVETLAQQSGEEGFKFLKDNIDNNSKSSKGNLEPWQVGYIATGGFLAPAFAGDSVATWAPPTASGAVWLDEHQVREMEPLLNSQVIGGWWFPDDASVDARRLTRCLQAACVTAGVQLLQGPSHQVTSLDLTRTDEQACCRGLRLKGGTTLTAKDIVLANGAWMQQLLPVPMEPHKGQSVSLCMPSSYRNNDDWDQPSSIRRVLFAQDCYIVPKADGRRVIVGATVEAGSWDSNVTPAGLMHILSHAMELVPALQHWAIEESWVGLRPTTPDKLPLLGRTPWSNLYMAGGYWRNGVLLAPKTGHLIAQVILCGSGNSDPSLDSQDEEYLSAFAWDRFTNPDTSLRVAANARYAAALHPLQQRTSSAGVATAVGTELGSYSTARSARAERQRDRQQLFDNSGNEALFEQAAAMGKRDAQAYYTTKATSEKFSKPSNVEAPAGPASSSQQQLGEGEGQRVSGSISETESNEDLVNVQSDFSTVGHAGTTESTKETATAPDSSTKEIDDSLEAVYAKIIANKQAAAMSKGDSTNFAKRQEDERPDPGFRIYHVDEETGEEWEVPPYTRPVDFFEQLKHRKKDKQAKQDSTASAPDSDGALIQEKLEQIKGTNKSHQNDTKTLPDQSLVREIADSNDGTGKDENNESSSAYNESTFDGYTVIQQANSRSSRDEELQAMREARRQNRREETDMEQVGIADWGNEADQIDSTHINDAQR
ncbi:hypothetical protein ACA910_000496 [Epithemia clementina (nom. ined.)]